MIVESQVNIKGSKERIWEVVTNIENASETIQGIEKVEILDRPDDGLVGLKWRETRTMFGKTATEDMWITESAENEFYKTRAESHGSIYKTTIAISGQGDDNTLSMTFEGEAQSIVAKVLSTLMGFMFKGSMRKLLVKDLNDIKAAVERQGTDDPA